MPIQIYRPTPKEDPMDKLSKALSVAGSVLSIKNSVEESGRASDKAKAEAAFDNPSSPESIAATENYNEVGFNAGPPGKYSANALKRKFGETSDIYQARMKKEDKPPEGLSQKDLASYIKDGAKLVPLGTKGSTTFLAVDNFGKPGQVGVLFPPQKPQSAGGITPEDDIKLKIQFAASKPVEHINAINNAAQSVNSYYEYVKKTSGKPILTKKERSDLESLWSDATTKANVVAGLGALAGKDLNIIKGGLPVAWGPEGTANNLIGDPRSALKENLKALKNGFERTRADIDSTFDSSIFAKQKEAKFASFPNIQFDETPQNSSNNYEAKAGQFQNKFDQRDIDAAKEIQRRLKINPKDPDALEALPILRSRGIKIDGL